MSTSARIERGTVLKSQNVAKWILIGMTVTFFISPGNITSSASPVAQESLCNAVHSIETEEFFVGEDVLQELGTSTAIYAETVRILGTLSTQSAITDQVDSPSLCIVAETIEVGPGGIICTGNGFSLQTGEMTDAIGEGAMSGSSGTNGGDLVMHLKSFGPRSPTLTIHEGGVVCTGSGGDGESLISTGRYVTPGDYGCIDVYKPEVETHVSAGNGGDAGVLSLSAEGRASYNLSHGSVAVGSGGKGGDLLHIGNIFGGFHVKGGNGGASEILHDGKIDLPDPIREALLNSEGGDGGNAVGVPCSAVTGPAIQMSETSPAVNIICDLLGGDDPIFCDFIQEVCGGGIGGDCLTEPLFGEQGEDAHSTPDDGGNGNSGGDGSDGAVKDPYRTGASFGTSGPGASASISCPGSSSPATNGDDGREAQDASDVGTIGGWGGFGWLKGGDGGQASAIGADGGTGGKGGTGGDAAVEFCVVWITEPAATGGYGGKGGASSEGGVTGGQGGDSWVRPGTGGSASAQGGSGGKGGNGGNGGSGDADTFCITICTTGVEGPGKVGCGEHGGTGKAVEYQGGAGGQNVSPAGGDPGLDGNPRNEQKSRGASGPMGSPGESGEPNDKCAEATVDMLIDYVGKAVPL